MTYNEPVAVAVVGLCFGSRHKISLGYLVRLLLLWLWGMQDLQQLMVAIIIYMNIILLGYTAVGISGNLQSLNFDEFFECPSPNKPLVGS
jgi:hypothetical protein